MFNNYLAKLERNEFIFCSNASNYLPLYITTKEQASIPETFVQEQQPALVGTTKKQVIKQEEPLYSETIDSYQDISLEIDENELDYVEQEDEYLDAFEKQPLGSPLEAFSQKEYRGFVYCRIGFDWNYSWRYHVG